MTTPLQIPIKYCKSLLASGTSYLTPTEAARFFHKVLYEWWGFVVNGTTDINNPGGFAAINMPAGFQSGTLIANGADGTTSFGADVFSSPSVDFTQLNSGSLVGKYLVCWAPRYQGQAMTDDGVYLIKSVDDPTHSCRYAQCGHPTAGQSPMVLGS
jgi:hypothetical protein